MNRDQMIEKAAWAIHRACGCDGCPPHEEDRLGARDAVDAILPQVTTVEQWEALPTGAVLVDSDGLPYVKDRTPSSDVLISWLTKPLTVVWLP